MDRVSELLLKQEERTSFGHRALWKGKCLTNWCRVAVASVCSLAADLQSDNSYTVLNGFHPPSTNQWRRHDGTGIINRRKGQETKV